MNHPEIRRLSMVFAVSGLTLQMYSTIGRIAARYVKTQVIAGAMGIAQPAADGGRFSRWSGRQRFRLRFE
jgi:hypothetical protein